MPGLLRGIARTAVVAGTATAVSNRVSRRQANRWAADQQQQQYAQQPYPPQRYEDEAYGAYGNQNAAAAPAEPAAPAAPDMDTKLTQLKELAALRDQGILTAVEFDRQKAAILEG
jgi:hypothetical protein